MSASPAWTHDEDRFKVFKLIRIQTKPQQAMGLYYSLDLYGL